MLQSQPDIVQYEHLLRPFAFKLTQSQEETADLIQDTFYKALVNQEKFSAGTNMKGWLFTIMKNIFINDYHKKKRGLQVNDLSENQHLLESVSPQERNASDRVFLDEYIKRAMNGISDDFIKPFMMHFSGFRYTEIAEDLGLPIGTVKSRIFFARKEMQANLKNMGITNSAFSN